MDNRAPPRPAPAAGEPSFAGRAGAGVEGAAASSNKEPRPGSGARRRAPCPVLPFSHPLPRPSLPAEELMGKTHPRMGGTRIDDFIFFKGDSQFDQLLIT